ncbi:MAG TPA: glycosyltransferase family 4 protein [Candidatus Thermoplasmatota archaeon]|nr:glycosyltransferase family 4 protein [Candidatus Thermoplasmatota archaeon]
MGRHTIGMSTQTPLLRFDRTAEEQGLAPAGGELPPHRLSPGGVTRMELPTLRALRAEGWLHKAHWFSLQPGAPPSVSLEGGDVMLHHLQMRDDELEAYARTKELLWAEIHGLPTKRFSPDDFRHYARYNARTADALLHHADEMDLAYIHDFQLLQVGAMVGLAAPCVLRWHVPWDPKRIRRYPREFMLKVMDDFDTVVVSTRRDLEGLLEAGFHGRVRQVYPHIDAAEWPDARPGDIQRIEDAWGLQPDDPLVLLVARMDPMKRQDLAIQAMAAVQNRFPRARLVLVGNGSFSGKLGAKKGQPGKAEAWRAHLQGLVEELGLGDRVRFAHYIPDDLLAPAYARASVLLLPSDIEGFGLTPLEAWRYGRVPIVSSGCGAAEVVADGVNGLVFPAGDAQALAEAIARVLGDRGAADQMGDAGRRTLPNHTVEAAVPRIREILDEAIQGYGGRASG